MCRNVFVCFSSKLSCTWTLHSPFLPPAWGQNRRRLESRAESCLRNRNAGKFLSSSRADKSRSVWSGRSPALISPTQRSLSRSLSSICPELTSHSWTLISSPTTHSSSSAKQHLRQHNSLKTCSGILTSGWSSTCGLNIVLTQMFFSSSFKWTGYG